MGHVDGSVGYGGVHDDKSYTQSVGLWLGRPLFAFRFAVDSGIPNGSDGGRVSHFESLTTTQIVGENLFSQHRRRIDYLHSIVLHLASGSYCSFTHHCCFDTNAAHNLLLS